MTPIDSTELIFILVERPVNVSNRLRVSTEYYSTGKKVNVPSSISGMISCLFFRS